MNNQNNTSQQKCPFHQGTIDLSLDSQDKLDERLTNDFDPTKKETFTSAHEEYKELRQRCPVAYSEAYDGFWALLKYEDIVNVLKDPNTYVTSVQNVVPKVSTTGRRPPLHLDPPEHTPYRRTLDPFFTDEKMNEIEPVIRKTTIDLLQPFINSGGGDICTEFSHQLPGYVFAQFFNLPTELGMKIREVTKLYVKALNEVDKPTIQEKSLELYDIARMIIQMRKEAPLDPTTDITSAFLARKYKGEPLPDELILGTIRQLIVVGMIAPVVFIGSMSVHLAENQDVQELLRNDPSLIPAAIEEYLRLFTPYRGFARTSKHDVEIRGRKIKKDEPIAVVFASANRDEEVFPNADKFILNRPNIKKHVAFGMGPHQCPGAPLARLILNITLKELLVRTKKLELDGEVIMTRFPEWGPVSVPLKVVN
ncbi:cytochrome P450 [Halalkalibacter krulwichiae]|uniref:Cytochrome P450-terp n=1 Tax=Halalkalibacter krulwichiae TaxID=199441 RepID=A0A1X9M956_9BACI|nr:cytochrome P450 [Halalkalibacter krulwichiae]ARK29938.1 Cytochrome P450-terp [Halalkalibacter krulwichiae]